MGSQILVVEDEADLADLVAFNLRESGHEVTVTHNGANALADVARQRPDLILLDVMLPDISGFEVCRRLRRSADTARVPVIMLTAKAEEVDRIVGFEVGADDYVIKPFDLEELLARIEAVTRRRELASANREIGELSIDVPARRVAGPTGPLDLSPKELDLLLELAREPGAVRTRAELLRNVWDIEFDPGTNVVEVAIARLRRRLLAVKSPRIETVVHEGYRLRVEPA